MKARAHILKSDSDALNHCAELLRNHELVAVPAETVYGLAGNALSETAVRKIFNVKGRPLIDPLITHFKGSKEAFEMVYTNSAADLIADAFWPGPITLVLEKKSIIPDLVTAGLGSAAVRVPSQPLMLSLLQQLDFPLAAPSANPFGYVSPTRPEHVARTLGTKIAAILDGGDCEHGIESTVLDLRNPKLPKILRPGPICAQQIEDILGIKVKSPDISLSGGSQTSPGQLTKHYSPKTEIVIIEHGKNNVPRRTGEAVVINKRPENTQQEHLYWLSEGGDLDEIGRNLFDLIQKLDNQIYRKLLVEAVPNKGIGIAINDRLRRAAAS